MSTYDGGTGGGLAPHRVRGVEVVRMVPVVPEPPIKEPVEPTEMEIKYAAWLRVWGGTYPEFLAFDWLIRRGLMVNEDFYFQCVPTNQRILRADLLWVPAGSLQPGDRLISFDEHGPYRRWRYGTVTANSLDEAPVFNVHLSDGTVLTATAEHPWLANIDGLRNGSVGWRRTDELPVGVEIPRWVIPWEPDLSWRGGWLAGFLDGEGSLIQQPQSSHPGWLTTVRLAQNAGPLSEYFTREMRAYGFSIGVYQAKARSLNHHVLGRQANVMRLLGTFRPLRLLPKFDVAKVGILRAIARPTVQAVEPAGRVTIARLSVDCKTYLVEGFGAHNSSRLGGRQLWGGAVVDFDFPSERLAWRIQGEYFHIGNPAKEASDAMQKMALANIGYICVDILAQDVIERRNWVLSHALNGEQARSIHEGGY